MMHLPRCNAARKKKDPASHIPIPSLPDAKTPRVEVSSNVGKKTPSSSSLSSSPFSRSLTLPSDEQDT